MILPVLISVHESPTGFSLLSPAGEEGMEQLQQVPGIHPGIPQHRRILQSQRFSVVNRKVLIKMSQKQEFGNVVLIPSHIQTEKKKNPLKSLLLHFFLSQHWGTEVITERGIWFQVFCVIPRKGEDVHSQGSAHLPPCLSLQPSAGTCQCAGCLCPHLS